MTTIGSAQRHEKLSSKDIVAHMFRRYETQMGASLIKKVALKINSTKGKEEHHWLGANPQMREWKGGRQAKRLREFTYEIPNKTYEATVEVHVNDLRRDNWNSIQTQVNGLPDGAVEHPAQLCSELVVAGESKVCYDGKAFFAADHQEGDSGVQSNIITVDITDLGIADPGEVDDPTDEVMAKAIMRACQRMFLFKDDQGRPINGTAKEFLVHVPVNLMAPALAALTNKVMTNGKNNTLLNAPFTVNLEVDPFLSIGQWDDQFAVYRTDGNGKPFIFQEEYKAKFSAKAEGSEFEFDTNQHQYGVDASYGVGYALWQQAVLCKLDD